MSDEKNIKSQNDDQRNQKPEEEHTGIALGMCLGVALGVSLGQLVFENIAIGLSVGLCLGMCLGLVYDSRKNAEADQSSTPGQPDAPSETENKDEEGEQKG